MEVLGYVVGGGSDSAALDALLLSLVWCEEGLDALFFIFVVAFRGAVMEIVIYKEKLMNESGLTLVELLAVFVLM
ncbi:hypothetical protein M3197_02330 [Sporosarcina aquimarina]|uniref:hypothetical protein n=1 Tax=Sporosarcina aquimarina TaxID=114975 RepID=UPI00203BBC0C|nr:hypothetical protein [Sporosarcina aquimarina]MCM3756315.1 hypothetical protein [Sporosarcina aquimarina]